MTSTGRRVFREMDENGDEPANGPLDLGVRTPDRLKPNLPIDIRPDENGQVHPGTGGMSVAPDDPGNLALNHRPRSLGGTGKRPVFGIDTDRLDAKLVYRPDPKKPMKHGTIEPAYPMPLDEYLAALGATAPDWEKVGD